MSLFLRFRLASVQVEEFERTCDKRLEYVHDRDGLDDTRSGMFSGQKQRAS